MQLIIASHNLHKIREYRSMLKAFGKFDILSLLDFPNYHLPEEVGATFEEIAIQKALDAATVLGKWVLSDDSGLVVPALNGAPGIFSARFAGIKATDGENRQKLLKEMAHLQDSERQAYYECCIAIASPEGLKKCVKGLCEGAIAKSERGRQGFGYDSIFTKFEYSKTFAELDEEMKNRISHRRKAFDKLSLFFEALDPLHS
ncbi:MAG: RdgB/HAM1 family non-canonical purine NTP pyrophosphatase [Anaerolineae bacterium]